MERHQHRLDHRSPRAGGWRTSPESTNPWTGLIVLANRAPFSHERTAAGDVVVARSASGLVTALEPLLAEQSGTWVAHASKSADTDVVDRYGGLDVPPANPQYRLRYVPLAEAEHSGYYYGFANEGLWPLCHDVNVRPVFRPADFHMYRRVNAQFATSVADEAAGRSPLILVQDYHFALVPRMLRKRLPSSTVVAFWHIPWPRPRVLSRCPWARELLVGLLGSHIVGLQTDDDCMSFLASVQSILGAHVDLAQKTVRFQGQLTIVRPYPVGIDWSNQAVRTTPPPAACRESVCRELQLPADVRLAIGIDRLDYTKGINEKFLAVERLLESRPELRERFVLVQVAEPSRDCLAAYRAARAQLRETRTRVNSRFGTHSHRPIVLLEAHHEHAEVYRFYKAADLCHVGSLRDGMNLVAKEFVCARDDELGVLVLSRGAGAAQQLRAALLFDPSDVGQSADVLARALAMGTTEQARRMRLLRANVARFDAAWWARRLLDDAGWVRRRDQSVASPHAALADRMTA